MIVVSDTSPISALLKIGLIDLLPRLFGTVIIPSAVESELLRTFPVLPGFLTRISVANLDAVSALAEVLDRGEAEAIQLAKELSVDRLLIDDRRGRAVALRSGLHIIGILGVILLAKERKLVPAAAPLIKRLQTEARVYLAEEVIANALRSAGEESHRNEMNEGVSVSEVKAAISAAFAETPHPGKRFEDISATQWDEGFVEYFRDTTWRGHTPRALCCYSMALSFFTDKAFRYWLPAFMIAELDEPDTADVIAESIAHCLLDSRGHAAMALLTADELRAIGLFLAECVRRYDGVSCFAQAAERVQSERIGRVR